jgi:hypothetical protein
MNLVETIAVVGAPIGAIAGFRIGVSHGVWWGVAAIVPGLLVGFYTGPLLVLLLQWIFPPRLLLSGGRRARRFARPSPRRRRQLPSDGEGH